MVRQLLGSSWAGLLILSMSREIGLFNATMDTTTISAVGIGGRLFLLVGNIPLYVFGIDLGFWGNGFGETGVAYLNPVSCLLAFGSCPLALASGFWLCKPFYLYLL